MPFYRIHTVQIAVPALTPDAAVKDEISALLTERGIFNPDSPIVDWQYSGTPRDVVSSADRLPEGGVFHLPPLQGLNILDTPAEAIVIPVNTQGVPGAGLAKQAADRWPLWARLYKLACDDWRLRPGTVVAHHIVGGAPILIDFPTKTDWSEPSSLELIETGLQALQNWLLRSPYVKSIAIPALGCGLGGLQWQDVLPLLPLLLRFREDVNAGVLIYPPHQS